MSKVVRLHEDKHLKQTRDDVDWVHQCGCECQKFFLVAEQPGSGDGVVCCAKCGAEQPVIWKYMFADHPGA